MTDLNCCASPSLASGESKDLTSRFAPLRGLQGILAGMVVLAICGGQSHGTTQVLSGTSYTQNFDGISAGLPTGWDVRTGASSTALGTVATFTTTTNTWSSTTGAFSNMASSDGQVSTASTATQNAATDRVMAIRQTGTFGDPGAAFDFNFDASAANFTGTTTELSLSLQMLSVQTRSTTWTIQYATGATPTTWVNLGITSPTTWADPGAFGSTAFTFTGNELSALSGQSNAWIRIVALGASTGSGSRDTIGVDDFSLNFTAAGPPSNSIWDDNGTTAGTGSLGGNWSGANWTSDATGNLATATFTDATTPVFAAGTNGGTYTVTVDTTVNAKGITVEEGNVTIQHGTGGLLTLTAPTVDVEAGATATISESIGGTLGLSKVGGGLLILTSTTNTFTGGVTVGAGTLQIASDLNLGDATNSITLSGGTLKTTATIGLGAQRNLTGTSGTLDIAAGTTLTTNATVNLSGTVTLAKTGGLILAGSSNTISAITTTYTSGSATVTGSFTTGASGTHVVTVATGGTLALPGSITQTAGQFAKEGGGTLVLSGDNSTTLTGNLEIGIAATSTLPAVAGGLVQVSDPKNLGSGGSGNQIFFNDGTLQATAPINTTIGLSIGGRAGGNEAILSGSDMNFGGPVGVFAGTGVTTPGHVALIVNNNTTFSGNVTNIATTAVNALDVSGTGSLTIAFGGIFKGSLNSSNAGGLTFGNGAEVDFTLTGANTADTKITVTTSGGLRISDSTTLSVLMTTYTPVVGDAFDLFDWIGVIGGASGGNLVPLLTLPDLTANNEAWDTSTFNTDGIIRVAPAPEPSRAMLLVLGGMIRLMRRRRTIVTKR